MHPALEVAEILSAITSNLRGLIGSAYKDPLSFPEYLRVELLKCALTCRAFAAATLPLMWDSVHYDDLPYLAKTMRAENWTILTSASHDNERGTRTIELLSTNPESDAQWLSPRFKFYASCIKHLDFTSEVLIGREVFIRASLQTFVLGETVLQAWIRFAKHRRLFPALTSLSYVNSLSNRHRPLLELIDVLRATHDIQCLFIDFNEFYRRWSEESHNIESNFMADLAASRCGGFERLEIRRSLTPSPDHPLSRMAIQTNTRRLVLKSGISKTLLQTILKSLPELKYCLIYNSSYQSDIPANLSVSSFSHLTHLGYSAPDIHSLKATVRDLPASQLEELVCGVNSNSGVTVGDILSIHNELLRWRSSLAVFKFLDFSANVMTLPPLNMNGRELVQVVASFRCLEALRSLSLGFMAYTRAETSEDDEEDGKAIALAYGDAVKEMELGVSCILPPPVFVPILASRRFGQCSFNIMVIDQSDFNYLISAAKSAALGGTRPCLCKAEIYGCEDEMETCERIKEALGTLCICRDVRCWIRPSESPQYE